MLEKAPHKLHDRQGHNTPALAVRFFVTEEHLIVLEHSKETRFFTRYPDPAYETDQVSEPTKWVHKSAPNWRLHNPRLSNNSLTGCAPKPAQNHNTRGVRSGAMICSAPYIFFGPGALIGWSSAC